MLQHPDLVVDRGAVTDGEDERSQYSGRDDAALLVCFLFPGCVVGVK